MEATIMNAIAVIRKLWDAWDIRIMILLSLFLQIILVILGSRRKYSLSCWIEIFVWVAYMGADSVAIAALGKLSTTSCRDQSNVLRGLWAPLLLVHLGGPDTITAMALEDNKLWLRHLLVLTVEVTLAIYVIVLSWTRSWLSILSFPLFLAGTIKYLERTWCLYQANSKNPKKKTPLFDIKILDNTVGYEDPIEAEKIVLAYHWLAIQIPDISNYLAAGNLQSPNPSLTPYLKNFIKLTLTDADLGRLTEKSAENIHCLLDIVVMQHGFMFDMLHTKAAIIYTKLGCVLRLISFSCSLSVSIVFLISFTRDRHGHYSSGVDIFITGILLVGAVALEIYALFLVLSSDWALLLRLRYQKNHFVSGIFRSMDWFISRHQKKKRWSCSMGQFDLLRYCISLSKRKPSKILGMIGIDEMLQKLRHRKFQGFLPSLIDPEIFPPNLEIGAESTSLPPITRGEKALQDTQLIETVRLDFDHSIMIWHIATSICYCRARDDNSSSARISSKIISDHMMYLLVMKPSMVSPNASVWFDTFSSSVIKYCVVQNLGPDETTVFEKLVLASGSPTSNSWELTNTLDDQIPLIASILQPAQRIVSEFDTGKIEWDRIKSVWFEMFHYAAFYCPYDCYLGELRHGGEFLTLCRLLANYWYHFQIYVYVVLCQALANALS